MAATAEYFSVTMEELQATLNQLDQVANQRTDIMTVIESRLFEQKEIGRASCRERVSSPV